MWSGPIGLGTQEMGREGGGGVIRLGTGGHLFLGGQVKTERQADRSALHSGRELSRLKLGYSPVKIIDTMLKKTQGCLLLGDEWRCH